MCPLRRLTLPGLAVLLLSAASLEGAYAAELQGRRVADVLREVSQAGLRIIYSDALVRADMRVTAEPTAAERIDAVREILRSHGLTLDEVAPGVFAVTWLRHPESDELQPPPSLFSVLDEVRVVSSRFIIGAPRTTAPYAAGIVDIERQPALFSDAARSLRRFPGTAGSPLAGRLFVRGGVADENLFLLDGVPLHDPFHLQGLPLDFSFVDSVLLEHVDFYSGVQPIEYGERLSSVVRMRTRKGADRPGGRVSLSFANTSALAEAPLPSGRGDWLFFARRSLLDEVARVIQPDLGRPVLLDVFGRVQYRLRDDTVVRVGALMGDDSLRLAADANSELVMSESVHGYLWASLEKRWGEVASRTLLMRSGSHTDRRGRIFDTGHGSGDVRDERSMRSTLLRQDWNAPLESEGALRWGLSVRHDGGEVDYERITSFPSEVAGLFSLPLDSVERSYTDTKVREYQAWFGGTRALGPRWTLEGGVNWSFTTHSPGIRGDSLDPRATVMYRFSPHTRARVSWGGMRQSWRATELPVEVGGLAFGERPASRMLVLGLEHELSDRLSIRAEAFDKRVDHPRARRENLLDAIVLVPELRPDAVIVEPTHVRVTGVDVFATVEFGSSAHGWLSYSWSNARDIIDGVAIARSWDQRHALAIGAAVDYRGWQLSATVTARSDWPLTPVLVTSSAPGLQIGSRNSERDRLYLALDLRAERHVPLRRGRLVMSFELLNATNTHNACCSELLFERTGDEFALRAEPKHWPQIIPLASVAWEL